MDVETDTSTSYTALLARARGNKGLSHMWGNKEPKGKKKTFASQKKM
jgi:hypothetical protein